MTKLIIFLVTGLVIQEPVTDAQCRDMIGMARFVDATGQFISRDGIPVAAMECGGQSIVLMLPPATGDCELEAS